MLREDRIRLQHMLDAANEALSFVKTSSRDTFAADRMRMLSVIKDLEIIGEAAGKVTEDARVKNSTIQWTDIIGMRNRLIHGYFDVDIDVVWRTVMDDLPPLVGALMAVLNSPA